jgi:hypothetical protein
MKKHTYIVYKTISNLTGKIYIGVHNTDKDSYIGSGRILKQAVKKHGFKNFTRTILHKNLSKEEAYKIEALFVNENFIKSGRTYNCKKGGEGGFDHINENPIAKEKRIEATRTPEAKRKRVESYKSTLQELRKDPIYNTEYLARNKKSLTSCDYNSLTDKVKKIRNTKISIALKGNTNSDGRWQKENLSMPIHQYTKDGVFIQTFSSISEASRQMSGNIPNIIKTIDKAKRSAYGFRWKSVK